MGDVTEAGTPPNEEVLDMLAEPGRYVVGVPGTIFYGVVEVLPDGTCQQLTRSGKHGGELSPDGWHPQTVVSKL